MCEVTVLQLSQSAADVLQQARDEQDIPDDYGVRVSAQAGPGGQTSLAVGFVEGPAEGDKVTEEAGMELYVSEEVAGPLAESMIDVEDSGRGAQLVVKPQQE
ncbi:MAG: hypothetical protein M3N32_06270 [Actinomycetota bacterium]|nr:hypothetical protein [Actinomycetota bacterium]